MLENFIFPEEINTLIRLGKVLKEQVLYYINHSQYTVDLCLSIAKEGGKG
ncbi:MAG: hypothetical protein AB1765_08545 [Candidatus Hydrogenedentota bacterium]